MTLANDDKLMSDFNFMVRVAAAEPLRWPNGEYKDMGEKTIDFRALLLGLVYDLDTEKRRLCFDYHSSRVSYDGLSNQSLLTIIMRFREDIAEYKKGPSLTSAQQSLVLMIAKERQFPITYEGEWNAD